MNVLGFHLCNVFVWVCAWGVFVCVCVCVCGDMFSFGLNGIPMQMKAALFSLR